MRHSLRRLLETTPGVEVVAEAGNLALAAQHVAGHRADVLVLDLAMADGASLPLIRKLHEQRPELRVVAISLEDLPGHAQGALAAGAAAFVPKERADTDLAPAVLDAVRALRGCGAPDERSA